jgi:RNA polymerase sigma factor (sigma-70 family)
LPHNPPTNELWQRLVQHNDPAARALLAHHYTPLVRSLARRYTLPPGLSPQDLVQEGLIGLLRALDRFDPSRGCCFSTFATPWIRGAIGRAVEQEWRRMGARADEVPDVLDEGPGPEQLALTGAIGSRVRSALESVTPAARYVLERHYLGGVELVEIARERGWHRSAPGRLRDIGLRQLRGLLDGEEIFDGLTRPGPGQGP